MIAEDEAKRAAMREQRQQRRESRLAQLHGQDAPATPKPRSKSQAKRIAAQKGAPPSPPAAPTTPPAPTPPTSRRSSAPSASTQRVAARRAKLKTPVPAVPKAKSTEVVELDVTPARLGAQIKTAIGKISEQTNNSGLRSMIDQYLRLVSPFFVDDGDASFPRGVYRHGTNWNRCSSSAFGDVLTFHIGDAVLAYYQCELGEQTQDDIDAIQFIHDIAVVGISSCRVMGSDRNGFKLFVVTDHEKLLEV